MLSGFSRFLKRKELYSKENGFMIIVSLQQEDEDSAGTGFINKIVKQNEKSTKKILKKEVTKNINKFVEAKIVSVKDSVEAKVEGVEAKVVGV